MTHLRHLEEKYGAMTITIVYKDLVNFLIEKDMIHEFKAWKKQIRRMADTQRMLEFEPNSDEETSSMSSSDDDDTAC